MQTLIEGIRISERGVGDDIKGATSGNGHAVDHGEDAWQRLISEAEKNDAATGKDIRGHTYSEDLFGADLGRSLGLKALPRIRSV